MKTELRNIKYAAFASEETYCFEATIYIDGSRAGTASNAGHGGPTEIQPDECRQRLQQHADTLPGVLTDMDDPHIPGAKFVYQIDAEGIVEGLVTDWLHARDLKRLLASNIVFTDVERSGIFTIHVKNKSTMQDYMNTSSLHKKIKGCKQVLNLLPFDEALAIYIADAKALEQG